jgi:hypothetical protein
MPFDLVQGRGNWVQGYFAPQTRSIAGIVAQVTIEEVERDELTVTEHPIEQGAPIADHAFKRPSEVVIRAGWNTQKSKDISASTGIYGLLLSLQAALKPFSLYTGKRVYRDMLITSLVVTTDQTSEYSLLATITCKQVILVHTQAVKVPGSSSSAANHGDAASTATPVNSGTVTPTTPAAPEAGAVQTVSASAAEGSNQAQAITAAESAAGSDADSAGSQAPVSPLSGGDIGV